MEPITKVEYDSLMDGTTQITKDTSDFEGMLLSETECKKGGCPIR